MAIDFIHSRQKVLEPQKGSPWADEMVLNPGIIADPLSGRIHMLFRATGPWPEKQLPGRPLPYPIFLGYAYSEDQGKTWKADFSRPALAPALKYEIKDIYIKNADGEEVVNHANGCIEDPRLFFLEGQCYLIAACRLMPPGPYWIHDEPSQCAPVWIKTAENPFGRAASENVTVNVLFKVDLARLAKKEYAQAFAYVCHLTDPNLGEDRDVVLFPEKLLINGRKQYVCLHRPFQPGNYPGVEAQLPPSIFICASENLKTLWQETKTQTLLAFPIFPWERNRLGASTPPLRISEKEWLLCYHGKQNTQVGYTQSFLILEEQDQGFPRITHRCSERVMFAQEAWELPNKFETPCVFITGLIRQGKDLLVSYGAADERAGVAHIQYQPLLDFVRSFNAQGRKA
jgi:predicted GH43/DUF377 family glycosyl hydrolase